jgi:hypothetical protein
MIRDNVLTLQMNAVDYINLLERRRKEVVEWYGWKNIPDCLWDYFMEDIETNGFYGNAGVHQVVDNAIVNGNYGDFDSYKKKKETDKQFIKRMKKEDVYYINEDERIVCFYL